MLQILDNTYIAFAYIAVNDEAIAFVWTQNGSTVNCKLL